MRNLNRRVDRKSNANLKVLNNPEIKPYLENVFIPVILILNDTSTIKYTFIPLFILDTKIKGRWQDMFTSNHVYYNGACRKPLFCIRFKYFLN